MRDDKIWITSRKKGKEQEIEEMGKEQEREKKRVWSVVSRVSSCVWRLELRLSRFTAGRKLRELRRSLVSVGFGFGFGFGFGSPRRDMQEV